MKKYQTKTTIYFLFVLWLVLAFLFESSDLLLSNYFYNPSSSWAKFLEQFGEIPGLIVGLVAIYIYFTSNKLSSNSKKILVYFFLMLISTAGVIYLNYLIISNVFGVRFNSSSEVTILILGSSLINFIALIYIKRKLKFSAAHFLFSRIVLRMLTFGYLLTTLPLKFLWGRIRFRDFKGDYSNFTTWYLPNGINGNDSFPSGHAAMAWLLISLFILLAHKPIFQRTAIKSVIIGYISLVCFSRIVIGAHFASDVLFGSMFMISAFVVSKHFLYEEQLKGN